ncbi:MAG: hypothetical protein HOA15_07435 [Candidatus Marinimicrobia bacterium]|jgi:hypothetical protein|nr:hypothetical protein [Candidatus Neomarinimicrobiota bacterium]MBT3675650.1 hypothetical protein [Candidatus Neomarinimicrobiota bacterium]MBT3763391.1 hypothetical protein [Candidatus Neomarinimicrobiota bacterium]MBT4068071.1 hypothetical protein [Candidatus Neomarinimicrobiota bacterium]MBT4271165.1 hypothetical protein [Candidatus Neomarinimicrobiota bacterium]
MNLFSNYSNRELNIWGELGLDILVSIYFFPKVLYMDLNEGDILLEIIINTIIISILYSILVFGFINKFVKPQKRDERDDLCEKKGYRIGYLIFHFFIIILIGIIVSYPFYYKSLMVFNPSIVVFLLLIMVIASVGNAITQLYYYRKTI